LIAAAERLKRQKHIGSRFVLAGPFDSPAVGLEVRRRIEYAGLTEWVKLIGPVAGEQKAALFRHADGFVLPSYGEGLPISMLEAMSYGLPVVATRVGGIPEVLRDGEAGILVQPGDVEGLCAALNSLCSSGPMRERMGRCGRACVERAHTPAKFLRELEAIYNELWAGPGKGDVMVFSDCIPGPTGRRNPAQG
jgi:glycosyltransferase involved in cell wall biosynthesis